MISCIIGQLPPEKRFRMRPSGVVSKNDMGALRMQVNKRLCMVVEAVTPPSRIAKVAPNDAKT